MKLFQLLVAIIDLFLQRNEYIALVRDLWILSIDRIELTRKLIRKEVLKT